MCYNSHRQQQRTSGVAAQQVLAAVLVHLGQRRGAQAGRKVDVAGRTREPILQHLQRTAAAKGFVVTFGCGVQLATQYRSVLRTNKHLKHAE